MKNNSWTLTAKIKADGAETEGVVMGFGGLAAGVTLYLDKGVPVFDYNYFDDHTTLRGTDAIGDHATIVVETAIGGRRRTSRSGSRDSMGRMGV